MSAQGEPKFCITVGGASSNTSIKLEKNLIHLHSTQKVKIEGTQKAPLPPLQQPEEPEKEEEISAMDWFQAGLAVASFIPGVGTVTGLIEAGIYTYQGNAVMAGLSLAAAVPIAGEAASVVKLGAKAKMLGKIGKTIGKLAIKGAKMAHAIKELQVASLIARFLLLANAVYCMYGEREKIAELVKKMISGQFNWNSPEGLQCGVMVLGLVGKKGKSGNHKGKEIYGPHYEEAKRLHKENPDFFGNPDNHKIVKGEELAKMRKEYDDLVSQGLVEPGHHKDGLSFGGKNIQENIAFTGETTIQRKKMDGVDLDFYSQYGKPDAKTLKLHQTEPDGIIVFGNNSSHTEATNFQNKVLRWQRENRLR